MTDGQTVDFAGIAFGGANGSGAPGLSNGGFHEAFRRPIKLAVPPMNGQCPRPGRTPANGLRSIPTATAVDEVSVGANAEAADRPNESGGPATGAL
jgi:hypothetical protein